MSSPFSQDRARTLAIAQDFGAEALELNRQLVAVNPADVASRTRLARCYLEAGRLDESEAEYREVLRLEPRNLIAAGGLAAVERVRHLGDAVIPRSRPRRSEGVRRPAAPRSSSSTAAGGSLSAASLGPAPRTFTGFSTRDFTELALSPRNEVQARFAPRVVDLVRRVNALPVSLEIAGIREAGRRQLFRLSRADVHAAAGQWYIFNMGGRWEPQLHIGMLAGSRAGGDWLRVGMGFNLSDRGNDPDAASGQATVREHFRRFQTLLASARRSLFLGWMIKEGGRLEYDEAGPRLDLREATQAAELIAGSDPERSHWVFFGKWLSPAQEDEAAVLADPLSLVRTIDRVFGGLLPLWRALWE